MLCVNNNFTSPKSLNFKSEELKYVVKIGKNTIDSDTFINIINKAIYSKPVRSYNDFLTIIKTCNFGWFMLSMFKQAKIDEDKKTCQKIIDRCVADLERAIASRESKETIDKYTSILEKFLLIFNK